MKHVLIFTDAETVLLHNAVVQWMDQIRDTAMWHEDPEPIEDLRELQDLADRFTTSDLSQLCILSAPRI